MPMLGLHTTHPGDAKSGVAGVVRALDFFVMFRIKGKL